MSCSRAAMSVGLRVLLSVLSTCGFWGHIASTGAEPMDQLLRKVSCAPCSELRPRISPYTIIAELYVVSTITL
jgi:hypothetical protein